MKNKWLIKTVVVVIALVAAAKVDAGEVPLDGTPLWQMAGFLGNWEIDTTWEDGNPLWARNEFRVGLGGKFVEIRTFTNDGDGVYERYFTIFAGDPTSGDIVSYGFTFDGTSDVVEDVTIEGSVTDASITSIWGEGPGKIRQTVSIVSKNEYNWKVWMGEGDTAALIMDGNYKRVD